MSSQRNPRHHNLLISYAVAFLALAASAGGIFSGVYLENDWFVSQMIGQDVLTLIVAAGLLFLPFIGSKKIILIQGGFFAYMVYTYVFYAFSVQFNSLFLFYVALSSLSVLGLLLVFQELGKLPFEDSKGWALKGGSLYLIVVCAILALLWLGDIFGRMMGKPMLDTPTGEPLTPVYILDLGFVIPAALYGAIQALRKRFWGYILTAVMLVMVATMGFALMAMTFGLYAYGFGLQSFLAVFWFVLGTAGLCLAILYLRTLKI